jgi:RNA polymerase sigma factor (sigma-70 family)
MRETDRSIAFKQWIYEIAKNACIDQFRRSRRAEVVSFDAEDGLGSADYGKLVTRDATPDVAVAQKQQLDDLCGAFGGLSQTHHEILVMRELEGLSYREIGERMGMTRPAVESTLFRARRRLTEEYDELVTGERCQRVQSIIAAALQGPLGARDSRKLAKHVSYCQPCMRHARVSGVDSAVLVHRPVRAKIASLLPLPAFLKKRLGVDDSADASLGLVQWSHQVAAVDPGVVSGWGKAAVAAATIALAGVGAGVATQQSGAGGLSLPGGDTQSESRSAAAPASRTPAKAGGGGAKTVKAARATRKRADRGGRRNADRTQTAAATGSGGASGGSGSGDDASGSGQAGGTGSGGNDLTTAAATGSTGGVVDSGAQPKLGTDVDLGSALPKVDIPPVQVPSVAETGEAAGAVVEETIDEVTGTVGGVVGGVAGGQ